jgi:hypothetical protein
MEAVENLGNQKQRRQKEAGMQPERKVAHRPPLEVTLPNYPFVDGRSIGTNQIFSLGLRVKFKFLRSGKRIRFDILYAPRSQLRENGSAIDDRGIDGASAQIGDPDAMIIQLDEATDFNASSCLAAGFRTRRAIILRSLFLPPGTKRPLQYNGTYNPHYSGNQKFYSLDKGDVQNSTVRIREALGHRSTLRRAMSCPERATARRTGRIGFQPVVLSTGRRIETTGFFSARPSWKNGLIGPRQAGSLSYITFRSVEG